MTIRTTIVLSAALAVAACQVGTTSPDEGTGPGPGPGTEPGLGMPDGCFEDHREPVEDPSVPSPGFDTSADQALAALAGDWVGTGTDVDGQPHDLSFAVAWDGGPIEAVYFEYRSSSEDTGLAMGEPDTAPEACQPKYVFGVQTSLDVPDLVAAEGAAQLEAWGFETSFVASTPIDRVTGGLRPQAFDPADWDRTSLQASFSLGADGARLDVAWAAENDAEEAAADATSTVSTGTVEPSGMYETVLGADLTRAE